MATLELDAATERIAVNLLRHLEWQAEGFSLVFLFADVGPSVQMVEWLNRRLTLQGRPVRQHAADDSFVQHPEAVVDALVDVCTGAQGGAGALWFAVQRHPGDEAWNRARLVFLARLNERRFLLEQRMACPLVLVLPADFRPAARSIAPDIWHVRALSEELRTAAPVAPPAPQGGSTDAVQHAFAADAVVPAYDEWCRLRAQGDGAPVYLPTALRAVQELLRVGRPADAAEVAAAAEQLAREKQQARPSLAAAREWADALGAVGDVARAAGDLQAEAAACRGALALRRELMWGDGANPVLRRELMRSLQDQGRVDVAQGRLTEAATAFGEALDLARTTLNEGVTLESLWRLAVVLNQIGDVAGEQGRWAAAEDSYRESLALSRQAVQRFEHAAQPLYDVSHSLDNLGRLAIARGDVATAVAAHRESLQVLRELLERFGETPQRLRDLSASLHSVGQTAMSQGAWDEAASAFDEALQVRRELVESAGGSPASLRDLMVAIDDIGRLAESQGDWARAEGACGEALGLARQLAGWSPDSPRALRDVCVALDRRAEIAKQLGQPVLAEELFLESLALVRAIRQRVGDTSDALRDLAISLRNVARFAFERKDWAHAEAGYREALELARHALRHSGPTNRSLRHLGVALGDLADVLRAAGDLRQAEALYAESLTLGRDLMKSPDAGVEAIDDVSVALNEFGRLTAELGDWPRAEASFREALMLSRELAKRAGETPETLERQFASLNSLSHLPSGGEAERAESLTICQRLVDRFPEVDRYRDWLAALNGDNPSNAPPTAPSSPPSP